MAHIHQEVVAITISKLVKDSCDETDTCGSLDVIDAVTLEQLEALVGELVGDPTLIVEVTKAS